MLNQNCLEKALFTLSEATIQQHTIQQTTRHIHVKPLHSYLQSEASPTLSGTLHHVQLSSLTGTPPTCSPTDTRHHAQCTQCQARQQHSSQSSVVAVFLEHALQETRKSDNCEPGVFGEIIADLNSLRHCSGSDHDTHSNIFFCHLTVP